MSSALIGLVAGVVSICIGNLLSVHLESSTICLAGCVIGLVAGLLASE